MARHQFPSSQERNAFLPYIGSPASRGSRLSDGPDAKARSLEIALVAALLLIATIGFFMT
jgi:hypothetical protein